MEHVNVRDAGTRAGASIELIASSKLLPQTLSEEVFYLCHSSNAGFVLVSADEQMPEVLGYSSATYNPTALPEGLRDLMHTYALLAHTDAFKTTLAATTSVEPLLKTKWNQGEPYYNMCPTIQNRHCVTGCVATAVGQVMNYYQWPAKHGTGKINYMTDTHKKRVSLDLSDYTFAWNLMRDTYEKGQYSNAEGNAVAKLMYAVGAACQMDYSPNESAANFLYGPKVMTDYFGYDKDMYALWGDAVHSKFWHDLIQTELIQSRPILFMGSSGDDSSHAFVLDGYQSQGGTVYYHVNWGWSGEADGYYLLTNMSPSSGGTGKVMGNYNDFQFAVLNCQPDDGVVNNVYAQLYAIKLSKTSFNSGEMPVFDVSFDNLFCFQSDGFDGDLVFQVVNESGKACYEKTMEGIKIPLLEGFRGSLEGLSLPKLSDGTYTWRMHLVNKDGRTLEILTPDGWPTFTVGEVQNSIDVLSADDAKTSIYDLIGGEKKNAGHQGLPAGFYIIDGRKVIVK